MARTVWNVYVRMENGGNFAEYNDRMTVTGPGGSEPTERDVINEVKGMIVSRHPNMKAGRVVRATARKVS
ncbi:hypothetical protein [Streptomyces bauhiniae]